MCFSGSSDSSLAACRQLFHRLGWPTKASIPPPQGPSYPGESFISGGRSVRVLTLFPGQRHEPVRCSLRNTNLQDIPNYEALSYAWGSPVPAFRILVNNSIVSVGENLYQALVHLRLCDAERFLWVDALCINQSDLAERNHQVQQMADIYSQAHQVIAWLGLETESSKSAFEFLRNAYAYSPLNRRSLMEDAGWQDLAELCQRTYWERVWIVQEICLAKRLVVKCGDGQIPWKYLFELRKARKHVWPQYLSPGERLFLRSFPARIDQQRERSQKGDCVLWTLLEVFQKSLCKEVHDRVYGFLGLSNDCGSTGISVDYSKSTDELYEDVIRFYSNKFRHQNDPRSAHSPQLVKLGEFLQELLGCHGKDLFSNPQNRTRPTNALPLQISATDVFYIDSFVSPADAHKHNATELVNFLTGEIPYSHLGVWRDLISPATTEVQSIAFDYPSSSPLDHMRVNKTRSSDRVDKKRAFIAKRVLSRGSSMEVLGVAPAGSQLGDLVFTFLDSKVCLVFKAKDNDSSKSPLGKPQHVVGRAVLDIPSEQPARRYTARLNPDKSFELSEVNLPAETVPSSPWPATVSIDIQTLRLLTTVQSNNSIHGFEKTVLDLMPFRSSTSPTGGRDARRENTNTGKESDVGFSSPMNDNATDNPDKSDEMEALQKDPQLRKHALGPRYAGIINLGSTGYLGGTLQILFMLKPFRNEVLKAGTPLTNPAMLEALQRIFQHLLTSSLPVSPQLIADALGWTSKDINTPQPLPEFFRIFTDYALNWHSGKAAGVSRTFEWLFEGKIKSSSVPPPSSGQLPSTRVESFFDIDARAVGFDTLEKALKDYWRPNTFEGTTSSTRFEYMPPVLLIEGNFQTYDLEKDEMRTDRGEFRYPRVLQLKGVVNDDIQNPASDLAYQLHGVAVYEEVEPVPRFLMYLRPRLENQWLLLFNESVTYASEAEVFEHNYRLTDGTVPPGAPLRTPVMFVYLRSTMLDTLLG